MKRTIAPRWLSRGSDGVRRDCCHLLGAVPAAIAASPTDPLAADQQSDREEILQDAIDAAFDAAQARKAAQAPRAVPKEFSVRINAPLYYNSNVLLGQSGLESNPEIALGWSPSWASLPFKPGVKLKAGTDRSTNVPQASQEEASGSFRLSYYDAGDDQAWAPFFSYKLEAIYGATFSPWLEQSREQVVQAVDRGTCIVRKMEVLIAHRASNNARISSVRFRRNRCT
jgi:hypothetical protein